MRPTEAVTRVMVVEDVPDFQEVMLLVLSLEPYVKVVSVAESGEQALEQIDRVSPDLVLMDFRLPGINGLETARRLKDRRPELKIAMVTAYMEEVLEGLMEARIDAVIPKPEFSLARIQSLLKRS